MTMDQKNILIEQYIRNISEEINRQYFGLMDADKISRAIAMFKNSSKDLELEIKPEIKALAQKVIDEYLEFQKRTMDMLNYQQRQINELAVLDLNTNKNGIYLSQQQVDLLMITDIDSKEEMKNYVERICYQFPNMTVYDVIPNFDSIDSLEQLEEAKKSLYQKYQGTLINYLDNAKMSDVEKAKVKLERLGINNQELNYCLSLVSENRINEAFNYLGQKYGDNFITKFNRFMNDDFENIKGVSYDEMKSLSELIKRDNSLDTIIIATGKFDDSIYQTMNGKVFDPYLTNKSLQYCFKNGKHMRYHALFDQAHVENLLKQGKGLQDHDQILAEMREYVKTSMNYIENNNQQLPDGTMLINTVEVFNELVEKNKSDKNSPYYMVWKEHFGITIDELMSCFDEIKKPDGVQFMYNETTLTESSQKRKMVEKVMFQIEEKHSGFIDIIGDQMHLSDEDVMTKEGIQNLTETAKMIKRFQDGKVIVDGKEENILPKKAECTEHDFHFSKSFIDNTNLMKQNNVNADLWKLKRNMQDIISKTYIKNGVQFGKTTYWSLLGKNDHNLVRANIKIQKDNINKEQKAPFIDTMSAGLVPDGKTFNNIKTLNAKNIKQTNTEINNSKRHLEKQNPYRICKEKESSYEQVKQTIQNHKEIKNQGNMKRTLTNNSGNSGNKGFTGFFVLFSIVILSFFSLLLIIASYIFNS